MKPLQSALFRILRLTFHTHNPKFGNNPEIFYYAHDIIGMRGSRNLRQGGGGGGGGGGGPGQSDKKKV